MNAVRTARPSSSMAWGGAWGAVEPADDLLGVDDAELQRPRVLDHLVVLLGDQGHPRSPNSPPDSRVSANDRLPTLTPVCQPPKSAARMAGVDCTY